MSSYVYFNGTLRQEHEVKVSIFDRSYLYGEGLFETLKASQGFIPYMQEHLNRLFHGIDLLKMDVDVSRAKLEFALYQTLHHNRFKEAYLKLILSRENLEFGSTEAGEETNLLVVAKVLPKLSTKLYTQGCSAHVVDSIKIAADVLCQIKSSNYLKQLLAQRIARDVGADEALLLNSSGRLVEGATSNLFIVKQRKVFTPPLEEGILPGITRQVLLELMQRNHWNFEETPLTIEDLREADEAFLTSSLKEVMPLTRVDGKTIGEGQVGPLSQEALQLLREETQFRIEGFQSRRWGVGA